MFRTRRLLSNYDAARQAAGGLRVLGLGSDLGVTRCCDRSVGLWSLLSENFKLQDDSAKPWLAPNAQAGSYALGMLGLEERKLLYHLARNTYSGEGAVVELGAFCGASTCCLAAGLRDNPRAAGHASIPMTALLPSEPYLVDFIRTQFGEALELGQSFAAIFRRATAQFADLIEVHAGDLLEQTWPSRIAHRDSVCRCGQNAGT